MAHGRLRWRPTPGSRHLTAHRQVLRGTPALYVGSPGPPSVPRESSASAARCAAAVYSARCLATPTPGMSVSWLALSPCPSLLGEGPYDARCGLRIWRPSLLSLQKRDGSQMNSRPYA